MNMIDRVDKKELERIAKADPVPKALLNIFKVGVRIVRDAEKSLLLEDLKNKQHPYRSAITGERATEDDRAHALLEKFFTALAEREEHVKEMDEFADNLIADAELRRDPYTYYGVSKANLLGVS